MTARFAPIAWRLFPALVGVVLFLFVTGGGILDPSQLDWLMAGDSAQHWIGWQFFRTSPALQWPLGANRDLGMELGSSIVFTDSIPLMAFVFKYLNPVLPEDFQYFGLWILLCFCLQSYFAWKLLSRFSDSRVLVALGTVFFAIAPAYLWRLHGHYALLSHWTLLAGLYLYGSSEYRHRRWAALLAATALIHAYLLVMLLALWMADLLQRRLRKQIPLGRLVLAGVGNLLLVMLIMWAAGYFMIGGGMSSGGFGIYRLNLLGAFDGDGMWSALLPDIIGQPGDYEGFSFLGTGMLILASAALLAVALGRSFPVNQRSVLPLALLSTGLFIYALSNQVAAGNHELFHYPLPGLLMRLGETFRATGRFFWPVYYLLYLLVFWLLFTVCKRRVAVTLCGAALVIQLLDMSGSWAYFRNKFQAAPEWQSPLSAPLWEEFARRYQRMVLVLPAPRPNAWLELSQFAATHHMQTNAAYFARIDRHKLHKLKNQLAATVSNGTFRDDTLYIFENDFLWESASTRTTDAYLAGAIDGFRFVAPGIKQCTSCNLSGLLSAAEVNRPPFTTGMLTFTPGGTGVALPADGWAPPEDWGRWTDGEVARLQLSPAALEKGRPLELRLDANGYVSGRHTLQRVDVFINGEPVGKLQFSIADPGGLRKIRLPLDFAERASLPLNVEFRMHDAIAPQALGAARDARRLGLCLKSIELRSLSY